MEYFETFGNLLDTTKVLLDYSTGTEISVSFPTKCCLFQCLIFFGSNDINVFLTHAQKFKGPTGRL
jgi:hypothetical protein